MSEMDDEVVGLEGLQLFKSSDVLSEFLEDSFNVQSYTTNVIQNTGISHRLAQLEDGICILDKELQTQIANRHGDLLAQATGIESLEGVLTMMQSRITSIQSAVERIRTKVGEPYKKIQARTTQLGRLQSTCDVLRRIIRLQRISKRLKIQLQGGVKEITKAAQSLRELEHLSEGIDLHGIEVFDENQLFFNQAKQDVHTRADRLLDQGLRQLNQTQTATALQVFYNLGCLQRPVDKIERETIERMRLCVKNALDTGSMMMNVQGGPGSFGKGAGKLSGGSSAMLRSNLWSGLEILVDQISTSFSQLFHLLRVLLKKRDPVSHAVFADEISKSSSGGCNFINSCWVETCKCLSKSLSESGVLKSTLESEYPKLLRLFLELWSKIEPNKHLIEKKSEDGKKGSSANGLSDSSPVHKTETSRDDSFDARGLLMKSLNKFDTAFLQKSLSRLFDPINLLFPPGARSPPNQADLEPVLKTINNELNISMVDAHLSVSVARNIGKTVRLFENKCEQLLATQGDASQVIGPPTSAQIKNVAIVNALTALQAGINKIFAPVMDTLPQQASLVIQLALDHLSASMLAAVRPLVDSCACAAEAIVLTMHDEDYSRDHGDDGDGGSKKVMSSLYMRELGDFLKRAVRDHFGNFNCKEFVLLSLLPLGHKCIELFVRHASLVRPIGELGRLKLSADLTELEQALTPLCDRLTDLGADYRMLRCFKSLLFQTDQAVGESTNLGDVLPFSLAVQILVSRSPPQLRSPHQVMDWSVSKYSRWLDKHVSEHERLNMLRGAVENHVKVVRSEQGSSFAPAYPVIIDLLQRGIERQAKRL